MISPEKWQLLLTVMMSRVLFLKYVQIAIVVSLYWVVSITTVFVNKTLLSNKDLDVPFFVLWYQCFISVIICVFLKAYSKIYPQSISFPDRSPFSREAIFNVLPVSVLLTCMVVFNALCLKYVGVSFYYIGRSLTTVFNVLLTYVILKSSVSSKTLGCCAVIVLGFLLGIDQENLLGTFSFAGTLSGLLASLSLALYSVYTKKVLPFVNDSIWLLSYYNNIYACFLLSPLVFITGEFSNIIVYKDLFSINFWTLMTIGGLFGFSMGYLTSLQIKVTSPLTHNISGTAKACVQTLIATTWYNERKTVLWWISNYVILFGSFAYAKVKQQEMEKKFLLMTEEKTNPSTRTNNV